MRPSGSVPVLATDATYPAGSQPWSGAPTRAPLASSDLAQGFVPGTPAGAEQMNDTLGRVGATAQYLDAINARNFGLVASASGSTFFGVGWDPVRYVHWATGCTASVGLLRWSVDGGLTWPAWPGAAWVGANVLGPMAFVAGPGGIGVVGDAYFLYNPSGPPGYTQVIRVPAGAITGATAATVLGSLTADSLDAIRFDPYDGNVRVIGHAGGGNCASWVLAGAASNLEVVNTPRTATHLFGAFGPTRKVLFDSDGYHWDTDTYPNHYTSRGQLAGVSANSCLGAEYSDADAIYMVAISDVGTDIYTSTDGISFVQVATTPWIVYSGTLRCLGSIWYMLGIKSLTNSVAVVLTSIDRGLTWEAQSITCDIGAAQMLFEPLDRRMAFLQSLGFGVSYALSADLRT